MAADALWPGRSGGWGALNKVFAFCEARGFTEGKLSLYPSAGSETSPRQEFLRAAMFSAASPTACSHPKSITPSARSPISRRTS